MKMNKLIITLTLMLVLISQSVFSQNGQYDVRLVQDTFTCQPLELFIDIEIKASTPANEFFMSDQNYRISFTKDQLDAFNGTNVWIEEELTISDVIIQDGVYSLYSPHTLTGSLDSILSYNVVLAGGSGYRVTADEWVKVGKLGFEQADLLCIDLIWHTHSPEDFPPTFIGEKIGGAGGVLYEVEEGEYDNYSICTFCAVPVELTAFTAENIDNKYVALNWHTASELNNSHFEVQRKADDGNWREIGKVTGNGTTNEPNSYTFNDKDVPVGKVYYRLKQVDYDDAFENSDIVYVRFGNRFEDDMTLFPNPVSDHFNIAFSKSDYQIERIEVYDMKGSLVLPEITANNENEFQVNTDQLAKGMYMVSVYLNVGVANRKFVK